MKKTFHITLALSVVACTFAAAPGTAAPKAPAKSAKGKQPAAKAEKIPMCPKCNMQMVGTSSLLKRTAIKVKGKAYYCCTICPKH